MAKMASSSVAPPLRVAFLSPSLSGTGNKTTSERIASGISDSGCCVQCYSSQLESEVEQLERSCQQQQVDVLIGLHAFRAGQYLTPLCKQFQLPLILILGHLHGRCQRSAKLQQQKKVHALTSTRFVILCLSGGTDVNEMVHLDAPTRPIVVAALAAAHSVVCFTQAMGRRVKELWKEEVMQRQQQRQQEEEKEEEEQESITAVPSGVCVPASSSPVVVSPHPLPHPLPPPRPVHVGRSARCLPPPAPLPPLPRLVYIPQAVHLPHFDDATSTAAAAAAIIAATSLSSSSSSIPPLSSPSKCPCGQSVCLRSLLGIPSSDFLFLLPCTLRHVKDPFWIVPEFESWYLQQQHQRRRAHLVIVGAPCEEDYEPIANKYKNAHKLLQLSSAVAAASTIAAESNTAPSSPSSSPPSSSTTPLTSYTGVIYLPSLPPCLFFPSLLCASASLNTSISEGQSGAILESMKLGVPVLARRNEGNQSLLQPDSSLPPPLSTLDSAAATATAAAIAAAAHNNNKSSTFNNASQHGLMFDTPQECIACMQRVCEEWSPISLHESLTRSLYDVASSLPTSPLTSAATVSPASSSSSAPTLGLHDDSNIVRSLVARASAYVNQVHSVAAESHAYATVIRECISDIARKTNDERQG